MPVYKDPKSGRIFNVREEKLAKFQKEYPDAYLFGSDKASVTAKPANTVADDDKKKSLIGDVGAGALGSLSDINAAKAKEKANEDKLTPEQREELMRRTNMRSVVVDAQVNNGSGLTTPKLSMIGTPKQRFELNTEGEMASTFEDMSGKKHPTFMGAAVSDAQKRYENDNTARGRLMRAYKELKDLEEKEKEVNERDKKNSKKTSGFVGNPMAMTSYMPSVRGEVSDEAFAINASIQIKKDEIARLERAISREQGESVGVGSGLFSLGMRDFTFGLADLSDARLFLEAEDKMKNGNTAEKEAYTALLRAKSDNDKTASMYPDTWGYRMGEMGADMVPFMLDLFSLKGVGGGIKAGSKWAAKKAAKKLSEEAVEEMAKKGIFGYVKSHGWKGLGDYATDYGIKYLGGKLDDIANAAILTNTVQAGKTAADAVGRKLGSVKEDEDGNLSFENDKTWGDAIWQAEANSIIENMSELSGDKLFDPLSLKNIKGYADVIGAKRISDMLTKWDNKSLNGAWKYAGKLLEGVGINSITQEVGEEYYGQLWRTILGLDDAYNAEGKNLFLDKQFHKDVWGGIALTMGAMKVPQAGLAGATYVSQKHQVNKADKKASALFDADMWTSVRNVIDNTTNDNFGDVVLQINTDKELSPEQKAAATEYAGRLAELRGFNLASMKQEKSPLMAMADGAFVSGYGITQQEEMKAARQAYEDALDKFSNVMYGDTKEDIERDPMSYMEHVMQSAEFTEEEKAVYLDYLNAKSVYDGMVFRVRHDIDEVIADSDAKIDSFVYRENMTIQPATLKVGDRSVYVIAGLVESNEDGTINKDKSGESIVIRDAETGKLEQVSPDAILSLGGNLDPFTEKRVAADLIRQRLAQEAEDKVEGVVPGAELYVSNNGVNEFARVESVDGDNIVVVGADGLQFQMPREDVLLGIAAKERADKEKQISQTPIYDREDEFQATDENGDVFNVLVTERNADGYALNITDANGATVSAPFYTKEQMAEMFPADDYTTPTQEQAPVDDVVQDDTLGQQAVGQTEVSEAQQKPTYIRDGKTRTAYHLMPVADTIGELFAMGMDAAEIDAVSQANIKEAEKDAKAHEKKQPKQKTDFADPDEFIASKQKWQVEMQEWQAEMNDINARLAYWQSIQAELAKMTQQEPVKDSAVPSELIETPESYIANYLGGTNGVKITPESYRAETGYSMEEQKKMVGAIAKKENGGVSIERAAEIILESGGLQELGFQGDVNDVRNIIIDILSEGNPRSYAKRQAQEAYDREREAELAYEENQKQAFAEELGFESYDDYLAYEEIALPVALSRYSGFNESEYYSNLADKYYQTENEYEQQGIDSEPEVARIVDSSEVLQGEQPISTERTEDINIEQQGGTVQTGVQSGVEDATASEEERLILSESDAKAVVSMMKHSAEAARELELSPEAWEAEFGENGILKTPVGEVKMGENQYFKLLKKKRTGYFGMIKPTLENPDVVLEEYDPLEGAERQTKYLFVKTFIKADGSRYVHFESVTVMKDTLEVSISSHEVEEGALIKKMQQDNLLHLNEKFLDSDGRLIEPQDEGSDLVPAPNSISDGKATELVADEQAKDVKNEELAPVEESIEQSVGIGQNTSTIGEQIQAAEAEVNTNPTEAQKEAGNYKKGHVQIGTFNVTIEQPKGSVRSGVDKDGKKWETEMQNTYGYIRGTEGVDGDHIDVFLSDDIDGWDGHKVFVVDQRNADGSFDEHKVMLGFNDINEAEAAYMSNYEEGWQGLGAITGVSIEEFEKWIASSHRKTKAFAEYKSVKTTEGQSASAERRNLADFKEGDVVRDYYDKKLYRIKKHSKNGVSTIAMLDEEGNEVDTSQMNAHNNSRYSLAEAPVKAETPTVSQESEQVSDQESGENAGKGGEKQPRRKPRGFRSEGKKTSAGVRDKRSDSVATKRTEEKESENSDVKAEEKIEDVGEVLAGARKDALKVIASSFENATIQSLIELPFAKAFKKPDLKKAVESGALREEDAAFYEAWFSTMVNTAKPKLSRRVRESHVRSWAEDVYKSLRVLKEFVEADVATRDRIVAEMMANKFPTEAEELAKIEQRKEWNKGSNVTWGDKTTPNRLWVAHEVLKRLGYKAGDKIDIPYGILQANSTGTGYDFYNNKGQRLVMNAVATVEEGIDRIVYLTKLKRGDTDVKHPVSSFTFVPTKTDYAESGRYRVVYGSVYSPSTKEFDSLSEAEAFAKNRKGAFVSPIKEVSRQYAYKVRFVHPLTGEKMFAEEKEFDTRSEAEQYLQEQYDAVNEHVNDELAKARGEKRALSADDVVEVVAAYKGGKIEYVVSVHRKYANNMGMPLPLRAFATRAEAVKYASEIKDDIFKAVQQSIEDRKAFTFFATGEDTRIGEDYRQGKDVTAEEFMDAFGFRGVQFGNWTNQRDRQMAVNQAYDALHDLAKLLGVSPKALSLNGELGIAFGSRGSGNANAHYELDEVVINLTKTRGAGSLAHEWWHALDNYFARNAEVPHGMVTDSRKLAMRDELRMAFNELLEQVDKSKYLQRSKARGDYWGRMHEVTARLLAEWVDQSLKAKGEVNTFLSRGADVEKYKQMNYKLYKRATEVAGETPMPYEEFAELDAALDGMPYPTAEEVSKFGAALRRIFDVMQERETDDGKVALFNIADESLIAERDSEAFKRATEHTIDALKAAGVEVVEATDAMVEEVLGLAEMHKQKKAPETVSVQDEHLQTVVSSADGAKLLKDLDSAITEYENDVHTKEKTFLGRLAEILGATKHGSNSQYATFEAVNGKVFTIRLANHNAKVSNFDNHGENEGISIVVTAQDNNGVNNDGNAHVVEFFYDAIKLRKADGKPLVEILKSIKQTLYSGEYKDTTGLAQAEEVNIPELMQVYHGSSSNFDKFDHSFMGTGEGHQAFGWGTYVSEVKGIAKTYAGVSGQTMMTYKGQELDTESFDSPWRIIKDLYGESGGRLRDMRNRAERILGMVEEDNVDMKQLWQNVVDTLKKVRAGELKVKQSRQLYTVEIPDENGNNYLYHGVEVPTNVKRDVKQRLYEVLAADEAYKGAERELRQELDHVFNLEQDGANLYGNVSAYLGSDKAASEFLNAMGFAGIKYPTSTLSGGNKDGSSNYVIFNDGDLQITDRVQFLRTADGVVYGWAVGGKVYLTKDGMNPNTPAHEYTHLWAQMVEKADPKLWGRIVDGLRGCATWNDVLNDKAYEGIWNDDNRMASEVLSRLTGAENYRREMARAQAEIANANGAFEKAEKISAWENVKKALRLFLDKVKSLILKGEAVRDVESDVPAWMEFVDMALGDLYGGVNPKAEGSPLERMQVVEERGDDAQSVETITKEFGLKPSAMTEIISSRKDLEQYKGILGEDIYKALENAYNDGCTGNSFAKSKMVFVFRENCRNEHEEQITWWHEQAHVAYRNMVLDKESRENLTKALMGWLDKNAKFKFKVIQSHYKEDDWGSEAAAVFVEELVDRNGASNFMTSDFADLGKLAIFADIIRNSIKNGTEDTKRKIKEGYRFGQPITKSGPRGNRSVEDSSSQRRGLLGGRNSITEGTLRQTPKGSRVLSESNVAKRESAVQLGEKLNTPINIVEDVNDIADPTLRKKKGWYDTGTGQVTVVLPNNRSAEDVAATVAHEVVAHKGLRELVGEVNYNEFLDETYKHLRGDLKSEVDTAANLSNTDEDDDTLYRSDDTMYRVREEAAPKNTGIGYKVFVLKNGELYPPMVANPNGEATPVGVWLDADAAPVAGQSKTGRSQVKAGGKGTQGGSGKLAYRPGWHLGEIPYALQFNRNDENGERTLFPANFVWAEVEYANDVDYQEEAMSYGYNQNGKFQHSYAGLPRVPENGAYHYRTNPNPDTDPWIITGAMRVKRLLTPTEVDEMVKAAGREPQRRQEGAITDEQINALNAEIANDYREGDGAYTDDEVSFENDPISKVLGKPRLTRKQRREFAERERQRMVARVENLANKLNLDNVEIITDASTLEGKKQRAKGFYTKSTGKITIVIPNHSSTFDVEQTLLHEAVAHYGLRQLFGEHFDTFLDNVFRNASVEVRQNISRLAANNGWDIRKATEEYLARLAEDTYFEAAERSGWWAKLKSLFIKMLTEAGVRLGFDLSDNELRYILWRSYQNLAQPGRFRSVFEEAEDISKQSELGVGNYAEGSAELDAVAEEDELLREGDFEEMRKYASVLNNVYAWNRAHKGAAKKVVVVRSKDSLQHQLGKEGVDQYVIDGVAKDLEKGCEASYLPYYDMVVILKPQASELEINGYLWHENAHKAIEQIFTKEEIEILFKAVAGAKEHEARALFSGAYEEEEIAEEFLVTMLEQVYLAHPTAVENNKLVGSVGEYNMEIGVDVFAPIINLIKNGNKEEARRDANSRLGRRGLQVAQESEEVAVRNSESASRDAQVRRKTGALNFTTREKAIARDRYERRVKSGMYQSLEATQDSMLGLKVAMDEILGDGRYIEDVAGFENAYLGENRLSSVNKAEADAFAHTLFKPMLDAVAKLAKNDTQREELTDYMFAKHGLERNKVMAEADAQKAYDKHKAVHPNTKKTLQDFIDKFREKDYAGLTALTGYEDVADAENEAQRMVDDYELNHDTDEMWQRINDVSNAILEKLRDGGLMDRETFDKVSSMYEYYIPLRGFDEKTSSEAYAYLTSKNSAFNAPIKKAEGRRSKADDPLSNLEAMAESAIMQSNRNKLVKQRFLNFVTNHPSDLVSVSDIWIKYDEVNDEWVPVFPNDIEATDTPEEVEQKMQDFEERMRELAEQNPDNYKRGKDAVGIPYRVVTKNDLHEHQVVVKRGGRDYVITINGNPRAAQALNGQTNPDNDMSGAIGAILRAGEKVNRQLSAFYTTRNPDFIVSNFVRDMLYTNSMAWIKESPNYALRFHRNYLMVNPVTMKRLLAKYRKGTLDMSNKTEAMFHQFMMNGGETGYANIRDIEQHKNDIRKELKRANGKLKLARAWSLLAEKFDELNRAVENCARFAAFVTSREMGRSIDRAIYDAKEISVNFNKKGSGAKFYDATGQTTAGNASALVSGLGRSSYVFWNAAIQGTTNFGRQMKRHPAKAFTGMAAMFLLGAIVAYLGGDDDEDDKNAYYNLPEYVRRSNILFRAGDSWISIPLPIEYRAFYGMGELMTSVLSGKEHLTGGEIAEAVLGQATQILPIDFLEGGGGLNAFVPSAAKPLWEAYVTEKSWTGMPLYKDTPFNKDMPEWTKAYSSANKYIVNLAAALNDATGGDPYTKGAIDINPAKVEYMLNGYFGGVSGTIDKLTKTAETIVGEREYDPRSILLVNRLVKAGDERTEYRAVNNEYFRLKEEHDRLGTRLRHYEDDTDNGIFDYAEKIDFLYNSPEYERYEIFEDYRRDIDDLYEEMKEAVDDEERKDIEAELNALKKELVEKANETRK